MNNKVLIIANWKCNPTTLKEAVHLLEAVIKELRRIRSNRRQKFSYQAETIICPPYLYLNGLIELVSALPKRSSPDFFFGAQDCFWEDKGAYTGEVSSLMLKNSGCQYVIIGHSERRQYFNETDETVRGKLRTALKSRLKPILCIGEKSKENNNFEDHLVSEIGPTVNEQLEKILVDLPANRIGEIVFAYEPVWAISTTANRSDCSPDDAMRGALLIRKMLAKIYSRSIAEKAKIIYGGSVISKNAADYVKGAGMDGLLVGSASLNASEFVKIIEQVNQLK